MLQHALLLRIKKRLFWNRPFYSVNDMSMIRLYTEKKVEPKWLHQWSRFIVRNSAPAPALWRVFL